MHSGVNQKLVEKRRFPRNKCSIDVEYPEDFQTHYKAVISDINQAGAFIETRKLPDIGKDILMRIHLPALPKPVAIIGEVVRHNSSGMGVKFNMRVGASAINSFIKSL